MPHIQPDPNHHSTPAVTLRARLIWPRLPASPSTVARLVLVGVVASALLTGCQCPKQSCCAGKIPVEIEAAPVASPAQSATDQAPTVTFPVRIDAGRSSAYTNSDGSIWLADEGFTDGETYERDSGLEILNSKDPALYRTERFSMSSFSKAVPNGRYTVKLHFCETFEGIEGPGQRVFSFNVEGQEFKDFDVWAKAGGFCIPVVESANVEVTDGKLDIRFVANIENPEINALEILPAKP